MRSINLFLRPACLVLALSQFLAVPAPAQAGSLEASISTQITAEYRGSNDLGAAVFQLSRMLQTPIVLENGTGSYKGDLLFADTRTLAASGTENLDLAGSLTDPLGATLTFAKVKAIRVCADRGNTNSVVVGGAGSNTFVGPFADATDKISLPKGGCALMVAPDGGWAVTASTGDILLVANSSSGTSVTYSIVIIGTSS